MRATWQDYKGITAALNYLQIEGSCVRISGRTFNEQHRHKKEILLNGNSMDKLKPLLLAIGAYHEALLDRGNFNKINKAHANMMALVQEIEDESPSLSLLFEILDVHPEYRIVIAGIIRPFESELSRTIWNEAFKSDPVTNWEYEYVLKNWNEDQRAIELRNFDRIERYRGSTNK